MIQCLAGGLVSRAGPAPFRGSVELQVYRKASTERVHIEARKNMEIGGLFVSTFGSSTVESIHPPGFHSSNTALSYLVLAVWAVWLSTCSSK